MKTKTKKSQADLMNQLHKDLIFGFLDAQKFKKHEIKDTEYMIDRLHIFEDYEGFSFTEKEARQWAKQYQEFKQSGKGEIFHEFIKDGDYYVGKHGLLCDDNRKAIDMTWAQQDKSEHTWEFYIPEGGIVEIKRIAPSLKTEESVVSIKVIKATLSHLSDCRSVVVGKTYYCSEEQTFDSGNIRYIIPH